MDENCSTCRFGKAYDPPKGECPPLPEMPKQKWFGLGHMDLAIYIMQCAPHRLWKDQQYRHENLIECRRYPKPCDRPKEYRCGEYEVRDES